MENSEQKVKKLEQKGFIIPYRELVKYNKLYPKASEIILKDFERISKHRIEHNKKALEAQIKMDRISQWQGFFVSLVMIFGAVLCGIYKQEIVASVLIGVTALDIIRAILPKK